MIEPLLEAERNLSMGLLDQAERLYRQVAEHDERNAIAVVGLARVAIERGDDRGALELTRQALAIDRQNAAAIRLEARLTEVLALASGGDKAAPTGTAKPAGASGRPDRPGTETTEPGLFRRLFGR